MQTSGIGKICYMLSAVNSLKYRGYYTMKIPSRNLEKFVRELADDCMSDLSSRTSAYDYYKNYFLYGAEDAYGSAIYNKTFAYIDDLESLLYSPVALKFQITNPLLPNVAEEEKGRVAADYLRSLAKSSDTDTHISEAVLWSLVKGRSFIKQTWKRGQFCSDLIQPEYMGVLRPNHTRLDEDMEAFVHRMYITPYQFERMVAGHPDEAILRKRARKYVNSDNGQRAQRMNVVVGAMNPFQPAGATNNPANRGFVEWMSGPNPNMAPNLRDKIMCLDELWVWDDRRKDWATFQIIGDDILLMGKYHIINALAWNPDTGQSCEELTGLHPFTSFCPNRMDENFWGRSEIVNVAQLQEAINSRITGTNSILRLQENPPTKFVGSTGVNQQSLARFNSAGGYWSDTNPNAKVEKVPPQMPPDMWGSLHEYERMFDEMGGLPPIARGHGDAGVRSQGHAETLVRMFSPRFKDRALLIERSVAELGTLMLNLARAHVGDKMWAWVEEAMAGLEAIPPNPAMPPPAEGLVCIPFTFGNLDGSMKLSVNSHSSSPAFSQDAKALIFDLLKVGAAGPADVIEHVDAPDPDGLLAGLKRRQVAAAKQAQQEAAAEAQKHAAKHK